MSRWLTESDYQTGDSFSQVHARMSAMVNELGLNHYSFLVVRPPRNRPFDSTPIFQTSYLDEWVNRYIAQRYSEVDPVITLTLKTIQPFFWGQGRFLRAFKKPQRLVFEEAREFQISYGLSIPVRGVDGELSVFSVASSDKRHLRDATRGAHSRLFAAAFDTHDLGIREMADRGEEPEAAVELSLRERECLAWTLDGKTSGEIATILNLSVSTVNHHAWSASQKLGGLNKHHAAVIALRNGLIP